MYAELLERRPEMAADLINGIRGATTQARTLIRDLLEYSRAGRGEITSSRWRSSSSSPRRWRRSRERSRPRARRVQVGSLPVVLADRSNLCRVFQNLIGNAVKFTRGDDPRVSVEAEPEGSMWRISVRDNGIGMDAASSRAHLRAVSPPARRGGLPGHRHRPRGLRAHRRAAWRPDLGHEHARRGQRLLVHDAGGGGGRGGRRPRAAGAGPRGDVSRCA